MERAEEVVAAARSGDLTQRIPVENEEGLLRQLCDGMNDLLETSEAGLNDVARVLAALAKGDLTESIDADYKGTFGQLKTDANATVSQLKTIVSGIQSATEAIDSAAREISAGNSDLSSRTEQQAASLEQTVSSMEEFTSTVKQVTDIMGEISAASKEQSTGIEQVNQTVTQMDETAQQNAALVEEASAAANSLEEQSAGLVNSVQVFRLETAAGKANGNGHDNHDWVEF